MRLGVIATVVAIPVVAALCVTYPFVHNHYIHPLGRLSRTVSVGEQCDEVRASFVRYVEARRGFPDVQFSEPVFTTDILHTHSVSPAPGLSLFDLSLFDDLQLTVRCGPEGRVSEVVFVGD